MVGIFGKKQQDDFAYQDQPVEAAVEPSATPTPPAGSIDGVIPTHQDPAPAPNPPSNEALTPDDPSMNDAGDYIMAEPSVPQNTWETQGPHQHDDVIDQQPVQPAASGITEDSTPQQDDSPAQDNWESPPQPEAASEDPAPVKPASSSAQEPTLTPVSVSAPDHLNEIREKALKELSPLVQHLDQSPEEKFHTAMMMLQATDDHSLVKTAYEAAQEITDEKTRAQALLDIVNEINYFSQKS